MISPEDLKSRKRVERQTDVYLSIYVFELPNENAVTDKVECVKRRFIQGLATSNAMVTWEPRIEMKVFNRHSLPNLIELPQPVSSHLHLQILWQNVLLFAARFQREDAGPRKRTCKPVTY